MKKLLTFLALALSLSVSAKAPLDGTNLSAPLPENLWIEMSKVTQPAIVGVFLDIDIKKSKLRRDPLFDILENFFGRGFEYEDPRADEEPSTPIGTGFIIDTEGHIVTNYHVIQSIKNKNLKTTLKVQISGKGKLYDVTLLGSDPRGDVALLKLKEKVPGLTPLQFGDSDKLEVGQYVAAFGNPYGHSNSMTVGIISAKGRAIKELNRFPFLQTDASINPGNSGGPLLNTKGYVIGVNTAIDARAQGIGFAIPVNYVKKVVGIMKSGGTIQRGFLGIEMATLHPAIARSYGIRKNGIVVQGLTPGYPAQSAGLQVNDIIYQFNGEPVEHTESFINLVQDTAVGSKVKLKVLRPENEEFKDMEFEVTLASYPEEGSTEPALTANPTKKVPARFQGEAVPDNLGFSVVDSSSGARRQFDVPIRFPFGPIVSQVDDGSPADRGGVKQGFIVLRLNGEGVNSLEDIKANLRPGLNHFWFHTPQGEKKITLSSSIK